MPKFAAGLVIYRFNRERIVEYLLLKASYPPFHWTPPKGHVDPGETDHLQTAIRETQEEAGLDETDLEIDRYSKQTIQYDVKGKQKSVSYWLAKLKTEKSVTLSHEHTALEWAPCEEAVKLIGYETTGNIIKIFQKRLDKELAQI